MWHRTDQRRKKGTFACVSKPRPRNSRNSGTNSDAWLGSCAWSSGPPSRTTRSLVGLLSPLASYSPSCLEEEFSEVTHSPGPMWQRYFCSFGDSKPSVHKIQIIHAGHAMALLG